MEKRLQRQIIDFLKSRGCWVMKTQVIAGTPTGTADIFFCIEGYYGWIEVKAAKKSKHQPLQDEFIAKMNEWSWARFVYPENWEEVKLELAKMI